MAKKKNEMAVFDDGDAGPSDKMREAAKGAAGDIEVSSKPYIHLCQALSPEVAREGICQVGDFYVRNGDYGLGPAFTAVVIGHMKNWVRWGEKDTEDEGKILWQYPDGCVPEDKQPECVWRRMPKGTNDKPPLAEETYVLMLLPIDKNGVDERGPITANLSRGAVKVVEQQVFKVLDAAFKEGWHPSCIVLEFSNEKTVTPDYVYQSWAAKRAGQVSNEELQDKLIESYDIAKLQVKAAQQAAREECQAHVESLPPVSENASENVQKFFGNESQVDKGSYGAGNDSVRNQFDDGNQEPSGSDEGESDPTMPF